MRINKWIYLLSLFTIGCSDTDTRLLQTVSNGKQLYTTHCANCHQLDGSGLAQLIPPLAKADFVSNNQTQVPCIIKYGMQKEIVVNGVAYNLKMPDNPKLSDKEIFYITQFVLYQFTDSSILITEEEVKSQLIANCP